MQNNSWPLSWIFKKLLRTPLIPSQISEDLWIVPKKGHPPQPQNLCIWPSLVSKDAHKNWTLKDRSKNIKYIKSHQIRKCHKVVTKFINTGDIGQLSIFLISQ